MEADEKRTAYRRQTVFVIVGVLASLLLVIVFSQATTGISANITYDATLALRKGTLQETVDNFMRDLDLEKSEYKQENPNATDAQVEEAMTQWAHKRIYTDKYNDGAYMWVQKVLDYDGGDGYAIRLIHPNLSDTEGSYLSTNEVNSSGTRAYEEELEGVKADGAVFLTYEFKKLNSSDVTKKITYSKLYKDYDWIVCMGVNIDDLDHYRHQAEQDIRLYQIIVLVAIAAIWMILLLLMSFAYKRAHVKEYEEKNRALKERLDLDPLTSANSRLFGERLLEREYKDYQSGKRNTLLLMMDVDFFKKFNDTYGHDFGDRVLQEVVAAVRGCIGPDDVIIRQGGDEFIVVLQNVPPESQPAMGDRILDAIRGISLPELKDSQVITSSMGFTYFGDSDTGVGSVLNRADAALYEAKAHGRNNWKIIVDSEVG